MARRTTRSTATTTTTTATGGGKKRRKRTKKAKKGRMSGGDKHAIALPKKGAKLAEVVSVLRQVTHRVNQHHTAIKRLEKGCVTAGIIPSVTTFTRLSGKGKKRR